MLKNVNIENIFDEKKSLVDYLPYGEYLDGVFLHVDGSVGRILELSFVESEAVDQAQLEEFSTLVSGFIGRFPQGLHGQMILWGDGDVLPVLSRYRDMASLENDVVGTIIQGKVRHISGKRDGFWDDGERFYPKKIRVFLTMRFFPAWPAASRKDLMQGYFSVRDVEDGRLAGDWDKIRHEFIRMSSMITSQLQAMGVDFKEMDGSGLVRLLYRWLNPRRSRLIPVAHLKDDFIREQVLYHAPVIKGDGFVFEGHGTRVITLKDLPRQTFPGMFAGVQELLDVHPDMLIVLNFIVPDQGQALERVKLQKAFAFIQRSSSLGDTSEEAVQKKEELSALITEIFKSGKAIVQARMHVVLWSQQEEALERACDAVLVHLHRSGAQGLKEEIIAPSLFLTCLPLNFDHGAEQFIRRERRLLSDNFADMAPLYGAMQGTSTPAALYLNRRGEPVGVDFFDSPTNPHGVIIGASGAGKSFLTNDFIYQNYRLGAHFFVLDKGHSYRKTCAVLQGQYINFDLKAPLTINPFFAPLTQESAAFLIDMLALMASGGDERDRVTREEKGVLQMALAEAYDNAKGCEVTLSDVVAALKGDMGARLALRLAPFTRSGPYGKFFDGPNQFTIDKRFTVFELAQLSAYPDLQLVVLLNIMFFVTQFVSTEQMRPLRKFLLIDEAWQLLKMAHTADFITNAFKTFRKYRCAAVAITQEVADLLQQKSGLAILANTANKVFLKQEPVVIDQLKKELCFSDKTADLLRSVRTVKGRYSEALVMTPSSTGVVRLVPDPFLYWVASSEARDNAYLEEARDRLGGDLVAALNHCAQTYPFGIK